MIFCINLDLSGSSKSLSKGEHLLYYLYNILRYYGKTIIHYQTDIDAQSCLCGESILFSAIF